MKFKANNNRLFFDENFNNDLKDLLNKLLKFDPGARIDWDEYFIYDFFTIKFDDCRKIFKLNIVI